MPWLEKPPCVTSLSRTALLQLLSDVAEATSKLGMVRAGLAYLGRDSGERKLKPKGALHVPLLQGPGAARHLPCREGNSPGLGQQAQVGRGRCDRME